MFALKRRKRLPTSRAPSPFVYFRIGHGLTSSLTHTAFQTFAQLLFLFSPSSPRPTTTGQQPRLQTLSSSSRPFAVFPIKSHHNSSPYLSQDPHQTQTLDDLRKEERSKWTSSANSVHRHFLPQRMIPPLSFPRDLLSYLLLHDRIHP